MKNRQAGDQIFDAGNRNEILDQGFDDKGQRADNDVAQIGAQLLNGGIIKLDFLQYVNRLAPCNQLALEFPKPHTIRPLAK